MRERVETVTKKEQKQGRKEGKKGEENGTVPALLG